MKTIKVILFIVSVFAGNFLANATGNLKVNVLPSVNEKALVEIENVKPAEFEISVVDEYGDVVFYKSTNNKATDYKKLYDFSFLDNGEYDLNVHLDDEYVKSHLSVSNGDVKVNGQTKVVKPYFDFENDIVKLSYLNFSKEDLKLMVYQGEQKLYEKDINPEFTINEGLDLSKLDKGTYRIVLTSATELFTHDIEI